MDISETDPDNNRNAIISRCMHGLNRVRLEFLIPSRGLFGYRSEFMTDTRGEGIMSAVYEKYEPVKGDIPHRSVGALVCFESGEATSYGLFNTQERGTLFITAQTQVYKGMGKFVLGISRSEAASTIFINACNEFQFLENVGVRTRSKPEDKKKAPATDKEPLDEQELNKLIESILDEQTDQDELYASELKGILLRLRPDFNEKAFGCTTFLKLLDKLAHKYGNLRIRNDNFNVMVSLGQPAKEAVTPQITKENWKDAFRDQLQRYKDGGFDLINPSILKADIQAAYPDFSERALGYKRFSDVLKALEKDKLLEVEMDEQKTMIC